MRRWTALTFLCCCGGGRYVAALTTTTLQSRLVVAPALPPGSRICRQHEISLAGRFRPTPLFMGSGGGDEGRLLLFSSLDSSRLVKSLPPPERSFRNEAYQLLLAALIGTTTGLAVSAFQIGIDVVLHRCYGSSHVLRPISKYCPSFLIPALGGLLVGALKLIADFPPGVPGRVKEVDEESVPGLHSHPSQMRKLFGYLMKPLAAVFTLGSGSSLGPEGPAVELGMSTSRLLTPLDTPSFLARDFSSLDVRNAAKIRRNRLLLTCGAAAGVAAGFSAPLAATMFALEIVQAELPALELSTTEDDQEGTTGGAAKEWSLPLASEIGSLAAILLSSVVAALVTKNVGGHHAIFKLSPYKLTSPLLEMPLYLALGAACGGVAVAFRGISAVSTSFFNGTSGPLWLQRTIRWVPGKLLPALGGLLCGVVGLVLPQVLFFGYDTLNKLMAGSTLPTPRLLALLFGKMFATAVCAASGLVGGTFAPLLFLGAMVGASVYNVAAAVLVSVFGAAKVPTILPGVVVHLADLPVYTMIGAASALAALFRAPLTATILLFELTMDYDVILPMMAAAGVGSLVRDILETKLAKRSES